MQLAREKIGFTPMQYSYSSIPLTSARMYSRENENFSSLLTLTKARKELIERSHEQLPELTLEDDMLPSNLQES